MRALFSSLDLTKEPSASADGFYTPLLLTLPHEQIQVESTHVWNK